MQNKKTLERTLTKIFLPLCLILYSCDNNFMQSVLPWPLSGTAIIIGDARIGQTLTLDTSGISGGNGSFAYQWLADDDVITGATESGYTISGSDVGKVLTCVIGRGTAPDRVIAAGVKVPYTIVIEMLSGESSDSIMASPDTGNAGDEIVLHYSITDVISFNYLAFSGISTPIEEVHDTGNGTRTYTVNPDDASDGIITITAVFDHIFFTVSFHGNGATSGLPPVPQTAMGNEFIIIPARGNLEKTGFAFGCWNTLSDGSGDNFIPGHQYQVSGSHILYAKWIAEQVHTFPFLPPENNVPIISGLTISQTGVDSYPTTGTLALNNPQDYTLIEWFYGSIQLGEGANLTLDATDIRYNIVGTHTLTVVVWQDNVPYSLRISFIVVQ